MQLFFGDQAESCSVTYYCIYVRDFLFQHLLWGFLGACLNEGLQLLKPLKSRQSNVRCMKNNILHCHLYPPLPGGSCWLKSFVFQMVGVSHWFPQAHTSLRQKAGASGLLHLPARATEEAEEGCSLHKYPYWPSDAILATEALRSLLKSGRLHAAPQLRQSQFILLPVICSLAKTEISLSCPDRSRIFP